MGNSPSAKSHEIYEITNRRLNYRHELLGHKKIVWMRDLGCSFVVLSFNNTDMILNIQNVSKLASSRP